jgi:pyruvyl transferase EpsO
MTNTQKISELKKAIETAICPLITNDYIFLDVPYYANVGDTLIWQGTLDLLKVLPHKCLYSSSKENYVKPNIGKDVIILLQGGGNFGDLWYICQEFRLKILNDFPDNKIILLPQSIHYNSNDTLLVDANVFNKHKNLTMCFRDRNSLNIADQYFTNSNHVFVPDMAFYMDMNQWKKYIKPAEQGKILFLDRRDHEKNKNENYRIIPVGAENRDWPTMENEHMGFLLNLLLRIGARFSRKMVDFIYQRKLRIQYIKEGVEFISAYDYIYTTRLHAGVLAFMLEKSFTFFDNSYGKNKGVYEAWLKDVETIKFAE